ncbi:MAG: D-alanyl-D-alanine carboxypeptidase family protein [Acidimicrobiales bacterium]
MGDRMLGRTLLAITAGILVMALVIAVAVQLVRSPPAPVVSAALPTSLLRVPDPPGGSLPWPVQGAAALEIPGTITFPPVGTSSPVPIASITKVMTALVVLQDHPLALGAQGPMIGVTTAEVAQYAVEQAAHDSVVPVVAGEQLSELQALEAMLVPSADNVAGILAQWDAGSESAFVVKMNTLAQQWGLKSTHFDDASGLSSGSVSNTTDLLALGERAMANPVIRQVVAMPNVTLPNVPTPLPTYDFALFEDGIVGIKTGSDPAAGGCFLFAAQVRVHGSIKLAYGVVLGQQSNKSTLDKVFRVTVGLVKGLNRVLTGVTLVDRGERVGTLRTAWGERIPLDATRGVTVVAPPGGHVSTRFDLHSFSGPVLPARTAVGQLVIRTNGTTDTVPVVTTGRVNGPSIGWRILHI